MFLAFFHPERPMVFRAQRGRSDRFEHTSGGAATYSGARISPDRPPVHLLFRIDTADPRANVALATSQWLPLLCPIRFGACDMGYRVVSDTEVKILFQAETEAWADFPRDDYPDELPVEAVRLIEGDFDPTEAQDVLFYAGIFGYDYLSPLQYAQMVREIDESGSWDDGASDDADDFVRRNVLPYAQEVPSGSCPDPECFNHSKAGSLRTIAIFQEHPDLAVELWGPNGDNLQIVWQICPLCEALRVQNQTT